MIVFHISNLKDVNNIDKMIKQNKHVFILIYMEGCGPCNATRPEWAKIESALKEQYANNDKLVVIDVNKDFISKVNNLGSIDGFPTMKYIGNRGKIIENYEDSGINKKDRSVDSFINWIENKIFKYKSNVTTNSIKKSKKTRVNKRNNNKRKSRKQKIRK